MRNNFLWTFLIIFFVPLLISPVDAAKEKKKINPTPEKPLTLKLGTYFSSEKDIRQIFTRKWSDRVTKATNGAIKFRHFPAEQLVKAKEMSDGIKMGIIDAATHLSVAFTPEDYPFHAAVFLLPFAVPDKFESVRGLTQDAEDILFSDFKKQNIKYLWSMYSSYGQEWFFKTQFDPKDPGANFEGARVRAPGILACRIMTGYLNAERVALSAPEVYEAAQKGIIKGCTLGFSQYSSTRTYEVLPYALWGGTTFTLMGGVPCVMRLDLFNSLPKNLQDTILKVSREIEKEFFFAYRDEVNSLKEKLLKDGKIKQIVVLDEATKNKWREEITPLVDEELNKRFPKKYAVLKEIIKKYQ